MSYIPKVPGRNRTDISPVRGGGSCPPFGRPGRGVRCADVAGFRGFAEHAPRQASEGQPRGGAYVRLERVELSRGLPRTGF